jgi:hypothetical protein
MGGATVAVYLNQINLPPAASLMPSAGVSEMLIAAPAILPYVMSATYSLRLYSEPYVIHNRVRLALFVAALTIGALLVYCFLFVAYPGEIHPLHIILLFICQGGAYVWAAELLLNVI